MVTTCTAAWACPSLHALTIGDSLGSYVHGSSAAASASTVGATAAASTRGATTTGAGVGAGFTSPDLRVAKYAISTLPTNTTVPPAIKAYLRDGRLRDARFAGADFF